MKTKSVIPAAQSVKTESAIGEIKNAMRRQQAEGEKILASLGITGPEASVIAARGIAVWGPALTAHAPLSDKAQKSSKLEAFVSLAKEIGLDEGQAWDVGSAAHREYHAGLARVILDTYTRRANTKVRLA